MNELSVVFKMIWVGWGGLLKIMSDSQTFEML